MGLFSRKSKKEKEDFNQKKIKKSFKTEEKEEKKIPTEFLEPRIVELIVGE